MGGSVAEVLKEFEGVKSGRPLYLPQIAVRLALGGTYKAGQDGAVEVEMDGESPQSMSVEDFEIAAKVGAHIRRTLPRPVTRASVIDAVMEAHRLITEELFMPGAARVLFYPIHASGSLFYRCMMPANALNHGTRAKAFVSSIRVAREAAEFDVVVFQIDHSPRTIGLVRALQAIGKKCVFEIDDAFDAMEDWHSFADQYKRDEERALVVQMMQVCDAVVVSTDWLRDRYAKHAKRIEVVPNMIPLADWPKAKPTGRGFRVLWAGSPSHSGDLKVVAAALSRFAAAHEDATLVFFGRQPVDLEARPSQIEVHDFVEFKDYPLRLADLAADVAIAPLADVPFNHAKSNVKLLEYWATGYPVVASCVGPYASTIVSGRNGILCEDEQDWTAALEGLYGSQKLRAELAKGGEETARLFDVDRLRGRIEDFYFDLAKGR